MNLVRFQVSFHIYRQSDHVVGVLCATLTSIKHIELSQRPVVTGKWKNNREDRLKDGRKMEGQTERLIGGLTDRSKNTHTDGQLIDQTYKRMD